jgi:hypothetical protein
MYLLKQNPISLLKVKKNGELHPILDNETANASQEASPKILTHDTSDIARAHCFSFL